MAGQPGRIGSEAIERGACRAGEREARLQSPFFSAFSYSSLKFVADNLKFINCTRESEGLHECDRVWVDRKSGHVCRLPMGRGHRGDIATERPAPFTASRIVGLTLLQLNRLR